MSIVTV